LEIWHRTKSCIEELAQALKNEHGLDMNDPQQQPQQRLLQGIGITNQRETTIAWNAQTGKPYYNAIVWDDVRTSTIARQLANGWGDRFRKQTGLPLASYFAGTKVRWLIDNVQELRKDLDDETAKNDVRFGTIDTWLMYQLTGNKPANNNNNNVEESAGANVGGIHVTDVGNASRWLLMDIYKVAWDQKLIQQVCGRNDIPMSCFPKICPSSYMYGQVSASSVPALQGLPLAAILGDQQSALFGQCALKAGEAKNTYGTGMFLMMNTGPKVVPSKSGLLTTVAYKIGTYISCIDRLFRMLTIIGTLQYGDMQDRTATHSYSYLTVNNDPTMCL
jgi:glycerol kinase